MNEEFTKAKLKDCYWLTWLGCAPIFDGSYIVTRSKEELEYHQLKNKLTKSCLESATVSVYNYSLTVRKP